MYPILFAWKLSKFSKKFRTHTACLMSQSKMFGNFSSLQEIVDFCVLFCFVFKSSEKGTNLLFFLKGDYEIFIKSLKKENLDPCFLTEFWRGYLKVTLKQLYLCIARNWPRIWNWPTELEQSWVWWAEPDQQPSKHSHSCLLAPSSLPHSSTGERMERTKLRKLMGRDEVF